MTDGGMPLEARLTYILLCLALSMTAQREANRSAGDIMPQLKTPFGSTLNK